MKNTLKSEELLMFIFGFFLFKGLALSWWWFIGLILIPDLSMLGYLFNSKIGAISYNLFHHKGISILLYFVGIYLDSQCFQLIGIILFSHASMDRIFGYGLKYFDSFNNTHLGKIGDYEFSDLNNNVKNTGKYLVVRKLEDGKWKMYRDIGL